MKKFYFGKGAYLVLFFALFSVGSYAQYKNVDVRQHPDQMEIVQVDYRESSTLVFLKYICQEGITWCNIGDKTYVQAKGEYKQYHLINSINMPINSEAENRYMLFDRVGQLHYFALEFEKIPQNKEFDIVEDTSNPKAFNFYGINIADTTKSDFMNIDDFISSTPVKEMGRYVKDNQVINYIKANGIVVTTNAQAVRQYGKYYTINMNIQNYSNKSVLFAMSNVTATGYKLKDNKIDKTYPLKVLTSYEYDKKVSKRQGWNNMLVAIGQGLAASEAGKSSSTTTYSGSSLTTSNASAYGYIGNTYGYANAYGSSYTTTYGKAHTNSYNGAAAYAAQQQANENINNYVMGQEQIRQELNDGYAKNNTIGSKVSYSGFFNVEYKKIDHLQVVFTIDGVTYPFMY